MGAAAQFSGELAHAQHAHAFAVFFAEQRHGAEIQRLLHAHVVHFGFGIAADLGVHQVFDGPQLFGADRLEVREIETGALGGDQRAFLADVFTQHLAQGGMQQMGGAVVQHRGLAAVAVDARRELVADRDRTGFEPAGMTMEHGRQLLGVGDREAYRTRAQQAGVAGLAAGLGVERRAVEHHHAMLAGRQRRHRQAVFQQRDDLAAVQFQRFIALEFGRVQVGHQLGRQADAAAELAGGAGAFALLLHQVLVLRHRIRRRLQAAFAQDVEDEVGRATEGVVQQEQLLAGNGITGIGQHAVQFLHTGIQRAGERGFLGLQRLFDQRAFDVQHGIGIAHLLGQGLQHAPEQAVGFQRTQLPQVAHGAADDAAQHITAAFVGRQHAVGDQERAGADVVGDDTQGFVAEIAGMGEFGGTADQVVEQVDLVVAVHMLQHGRDALQAHAGVHARRRQRQQGAVRLAVELHEHVVPNFDVAVAVLVRRTGRPAGDVLAVVVEDLGAGTARAGIGHLPEIVGSVRCALVVADADDALGRQTDVLVPDVEGFVIGVVDGDQQPVFRQLPDAGQQFPGVGDGVLLEIVAETEVAQHLEEGVVARGVADLVEVVVLAAGAHAALRTDRPGVAAFLGAEEHVLELHHAGVGEQQGGIVAGHQRATGHNGVAFGREEIQEVLADLRTRARSGFGHGLPETKRNGDRRPSP